MATQTPTTTTTLSNNIMSYFSKRLLGTLRKNFVLDRYCSKRSLPRHSGETITWIRYSDFAESTAAITEANVPDSIALTSAQVTATLSQFGDYVVVGDWIQATSIDDVMKSTIDLLAYRAGNTRDALIRDEIFTGGTAQYAGSGSALSDVGTADTMCLDEIDTAVKTLRAANAEEFEDGSFVGVIHANVEYQLLGASATNGFMEVTKYATPDKIVKGEIGKLKGVKFIRSNIMQDEGTNQYGSAILSRDAIGAVTLDGENLKTYLKTAGSGGVSDPLDQLNTVGYKFSFVAKTLEAARAIRLYSYYA